MPLRSRLALLSAAAVAVAVSAIAVAAWLVTHQQLTDQLDSNLRSVQASPSFVRGLLRTCGLDESTTTDGSPTPYTVQVVTADGTVCTEPGRPSISVTEGDLAVARGESNDDLHDALASDGRTMRVATSRPFPSADTGLQGSYAVSIAQPVSVVNGPLGTLALVLIGVAGAGVLVAATAGLVVARAALRPVGRLTDSVEHIARTEDLTIRIPVDGDDEIARLSNSFNSMAEALASSRDRQQRLIADAGHELRTPLTSLRTNIELLIRSEESGRVLSSEVRTDLLSSLKSQISELTTLIGDLQELSRPEQTHNGRELHYVDLREVASRATDRAKLRGADLQFTTEFEPWYVRAEPSAMERAIVNVLDNAVKYSPPAGAIHVRLAAGVLTVRDFGPGVPEGELPFVFERFWRSPSSRGLPGSGLGLSIVARTIRQAGGTVVLRNAEGHGTEVVVRLPGAPTLPPAVPSDT
ncbi:sensor histidine kinase [Streptomyces sp. NPDC055036]